MLKSKTVLVLGAGASCDINLPAAPKLAQRIQKALDIQLRRGTILNGDELIAVACSLAAKSKGKDVMEYIRAARTISLGLPTADSIDAFIDRHPDDPFVKTCGKLAIVNEILEAERNSSIYSGGGDQPAKLDGATTSWLDSFARLLFAGIYKADVENVFENLFVINFNYDRCFEYYLASALMDGYGLSQHDARNLVGRLRCWHPYGTVGDLWLPATADAQGETVMYGGYADAHQLLKLSSRIRTFTEQVQNEDLMEPRSWLAQAKMVLFMGFAFHRQNMKLIKPETVPREPKALYGTAYQMSRADISVVRSSIRKMFDIRVEGDLSFPLRGDCDCRLLLLEYRRAIEEGLVWREQI